MQHVIALPWFTWVIFRHFGFWAHGRNVGDRKLRYASEHFNLIVKACLNGFNICFNMHSTLCWMLCWTLRLGRKSLTLMVCFKFFVASFLSKGRKRMDIRSDRPKGDSFLAAALWGWRFVSIKSRLLLSLVAKFTICLRRKCLESPSRPDDWNHQQG